MRPAHPGSCLGPAKDCALRPGPRPAPSSQLPAPSPQLPAPSPQPCPISGSLHPDAPPPSPSPGNHLAHSRPVSPSSRPPLSRRPPARWKRSRTEGWGSPALRCEPRQTPRPPQSALCATGGSTAPSRSGSPRRTGGRSSMRGGGSRAPGSPLPGLGWGKGGVQAEVGGSECREACTRSLARPRGREWPAALGVRARTGG